jgi:hypothetical protein
MLRGSTSQLSTRSKRNNAASLPPVSRILEYEVISVNSNARRHHVLSGLAGRLERNEVGLVTHGRKCIPGAEVLPVSGRT